MFMHLHLNNVTAPPPPSREDGAQMSVIIIIWSPDRRETIYPGYHGSVHAAGAMNDKQIAFLIPTADNADVGILRVEYEIAGDGLAPLDAPAIAMLARRSAAVTDHISSIGHVVKYPIDKTGAIKPVWAIGSSSGAAVCPDLLNRSPSGVPTDHKALDSDR